MKKTFLSLGVACLLSSSLLAEQNIFFIGANINFARIAQEQEANTFLFTAWEKSNATAFGAGALIGYKHFFNDKLGFRAYLDANSNIF
ncbi:hypothetical protein DMB92_00555 [Campylobacter sp. MIT 99-7217]|uniref:hypothetical protein n=1 Tax=Campylobacter sp. MIT 99-7217 TaxID=535091 RepID=UPI001158B5FC|nr:hypothetical protein [Campylobacter sp. MIT 99-7217]TQR34490.1 hypothetical protein DMB92_00555 [Campylobacter sp. MIT 99-7217]